MLGAMVGVSRVALRRRRRRRLAGISSAEATDVQSLEGGQAQQKPEPQAGLYAEAAMRGVERFLVGELSLMARSQKCKASSSSTKKPTARQEWRLSRSVRAWQRITWPVIDDHPLCLRVSHDAAARICMFASCVRREYVGFRLTNHQENDVAIFICTDLSCKYEVTSLSLSACQRIGGHALLPCR